MKNIILLIAIVTSSVIVLSSCSGASEQSKPLLQSETSSTSETEDGQTSDKGSPVDTAKPADNGGQQQQTLELIKPDKAKEMLESDEDILLLDVRTQAEYDEIHIPGSMLLPVEELSGRVDELESWQNKTVIVYCRTGRRSAAAAKILADAGFMTVYDLGGIYDWPYETE